MTDKKADDVQRFYVENPEWTYGRKLVVLATDYDRLQTENTILRKQNEQLQEQKAEWERAARIARERSSGRVSLVKTTLATDARGLPIAPTKLSGEPS